jgi:hypothetical protein
MNQRMFELMQGRAELLARIAAQREQMTEFGTHWRTPLALADQGVAAVRFLRCHPLLAAGVKNYFAMRRRGAAGLVRRVWRVWKGYRYVAFFSKKLSSRS